jgi:hypothetical protein
MKFGRSIGNEEGSVLVISVVILALLTVIGIAATTTTSIELQIAGNDRVYKENLYQAEGAAMMLARVLEDLTPEDNEKLDVEKKFKTPSGEYEDVVDPNVNDVEVSDIANPSYWEGQNDRSCEMPGIATANAPKVIARHEGIPPGASLGMTGGTNLYQYAIFGRQAQAANNSGVVIAIGYRKRY